MITTYKLSIFKGIKEIIFKYAEIDFPIKDTEIVLYDAYKFCIMLSDGLAAILNDRNDIYNSFSGDIFVFNPSEIHHARILRQGIHRYIEILIPTEYFPNFKEYYSLFNDKSESRTNHLSPSPKDRALILSVAEKIINSIKTLPDDVTLFTDLIELLKISGHLYDNKETDNISQYIPATLQRAIEFIRKEFSENIQISDIASASSCSESYLCRIFKKHLGKSPYLYLTQYRLFVAEKLLKNKSSVTEVAAMTGFCDSSTFIKCFKKAFGTTPLKYKSTHKQ